jgi:sorbitol/mannitol transport system substrate-binding protein
MGRRIVRSSVSGVRGRKFSRGQVLKMGGALAAGSVAMPWLAGCGGSEDLSGSEITIAAVNNPQMEDMEGLADRFREQSGITARFQFLPENDLRQRVTQDVSLNAGNFDIVMVGAYETPIWAQSEWLEPLDSYFDNLSQEQANNYDLDDILQTWRTALSYEDQLYSLPFYGESSMLFYRTDLFEEAGIEMPERPTWDEVTGFAEQLHDPGNNLNGLALRGLPGWGANMANFMTILNTYGGRFYNENWEPQLTTPEVRNAIDQYITLANNFAQSGITSDNFPECLTLFSSGNAAMWCDATVAGGLVSDPEASEVAENVGFAYAPTAVTPNGANWLWCWSLGIEAASKNKEAAFEFLRWATSKDYINLVGEELGYNRVPPGTRESTSEDTPYGENPWTDVELTSIQTATLDNPTRDPVPYDGIQYIPIPEWQQLGDAVGRLLASVVTGDITPEEMQERAQQEALDVARQGQYLQS